MGAVVEIWLESLIPFLQRDSRIVQWEKAHLKPISNVENKEEQSQV